MYNGVILILLRVVMKFLLRVLRSINENISFSMFVKFFLYFLYWERVRESERGVYILKRCFLVFGDMFKCFMY